VFVIFTRIILAHFYVHGGYLLDAGELAYLIWHNGIIPQNPALVIDPHYLNLFQNHSFLFAIPLSWISYLTPFPMAVWFAIIYGAGHAFIVIFGYVIFRILLGNSLLSQVGAAIGAVCLIVSSPVTEALGYPHLEWLIFPTGSILVLGLMLRRPWLIGLGLILVAAVREDCGAHAAAPMILVLIFSTLFPRFFGFMDAGARRLYFFATVGSLLLMLATMFGPLLFESRMPTEVSEYFGNPFYGYVNQTFLAQQFHFFFTEKSFLWAPLLLLVIAGLVRRDVIWVAAGLAALPWLIFNLMGEQDGVRHLTSYHVFPVYYVFLFACIPRSTLSVSESELKKVRLPAPDLLRAGVVMGALVLSIILTPLDTWYWRWDDFFDAPSSDQITRTEQFYKVLPQVRDQLGPIYSDDAIMALAPDLFTRQDTGSELSNPPRHPDTYLYFQKTWHSEALIPIFRPEYRTYQFTGTHLMLATRRDIAQIPLLRDKVEPISPLASLMSFHDNVTFDAQGVTLGGLNEPGILMYGPYVRLQPGNYEVSMDMKRAKGTDTNGCKLEVFVEGKVVASTAPFTGAADELEARPVIPFTVDPVDKEKHFEFRVFQQGQRPISITSLAVHPVAKP